MPLSQSQLSELQNNITRAKSLLKELDADITKATMAGIDVAAQRAQHADLQKTITQLELHYIGK